MGNVKWKLIVSRSMILRAPGDAIHKDAIWLLYIGHHLAGEGIPGVHMYF